MTKIDLSQLSTAELQEALEKKRKAEKTAFEKAHREFEQEKNSSLEKRAKEFQYYHEKLKQLKADIIKEMNNYYIRMYELNGKKPRDVKSFSFKNTNDTVKITVDSQERFEFTEEAMVHIGVIKDIFREKFAKRNQGLYNLLDGLLIKNSKMEYDPKLLAKARRQVRDLGDEKLIEEFDKLDACQRVVGTSLYCRVHIRDANNKWKEVSLNFSSL